MNIYDNVPTDELAKKEYWDTITLNHKQQKNEFYRYLKGLRKKGMSYQEMIDLAWIYNKEHEMGFVNIEDMVRFVGRNPEPRSFYRAPE